MQLRVGYELIYECPQPTPMVLMLNIHHTRAGDIIVADRMTVDPFVPASSYRDGFGNWCTRLVAPAGRLRLSANAVLNDTGEPDPIALSESPSTIRMPGRRERRGRLSRKAKACAATTRTWRSRSAAA